MKKLSLLSTLILCCLFSFAQPSDAILLSKMNTGKMPGASFVVIKEGKWIYGKNLGLANTSTSKPVDDQTIFMQASVSKTMIATAVMQLWEKGMINLDVDVNRYLKFPVRTPSFPNDSITARMLLTHTSAIKDEWNTMGALYQLGDSPISLDSFLRNYLLPSGIYYSSANYYSYQPGTQYNYSNIGSTLAAYLVEAITGDAFSHYCDTAIFSKICMNHTSFLLSGVSDTTKIARPYYWDNGTYNDAGLYGYPDYPDGQLRTTSTDMARFMTMYMQYGIYEGSRILDSATVAYMLKQQTVVDPDQGIIFYKGIASNGDVLWGHNGGDVGVNTAMYFNSVKKTGVIVMTNGDGTTAVNADLLANDLYQYGITVTPGMNDTFPSCGTATSINTVNALKNIAFYPNPATTELHIDMPVDGVVTFYDMSGKVRYQSPVTRSWNKLPLDRIASPGLYLLKITDKEGKYSIIKKITILK
ncbi:MAG TPA: serine hydrolase [Flavipsychrobacter sp.]|nr:serine hydrolase [Flavipsychrobacter sp.]